MTELRISHTLALAIEAVTSTSAIVGIRGSGKTNTAVVIVEEAVKAGQQVCVLDPLDVWWGLGSSKSGDSEGLPVLVMGGQHQHLPLECESAEAIARFVADNRIPVVLSMRHLSIGKQREFVAVFLEHLYHFKGEPGKQTPLLVVIDECSTFCPQAIRRGAEGGFESRCLGACETLVRRGRSSGFGFIAVDQRPASINKDVLTQLEVLIVHRVTSPQDRDALNEWVKGHDTDGHSKEMFGSAASLSLGECWAWSPGMDLFARVQIRERETFDSSKTPKIGEQAFEPSAFAMIDVEGFRSVLESSRGEAKKKDPVWMAKRIIELEEQLEDGGDSGRVAELEAMVFDRERHINIIQEERCRLAQVITDARQTINKLQALFLPGVEMFTPNDPHGRTETRRYPDSAFMESEPIEIPESPTTDRIGGPLNQKSQELPQATLAKIENRAPGIHIVQPGPVTGPQQRILNALRSFEPLGLKECSKTVVAMFSGASPRSSSFGNNLGALRTKGMIDYPRGGFVSLTCIGRGLAEPPSITPTLKSLHEAWFEKLSGPQARILQTLIEAYPHQVSKLHIATATGQSLTSSSFGNNLGFLRNSLGLIEYPSSGMVKASALLFPEGLK